jgi:hypothetical protein
MSKHVPQPKDIGRGPVDRFKIGDNIEVLYWTVQFDDNTKRMHWMFNRLKPLEANCACFCVDDVLELPWVLATLAHGFSDLPYLEPVVRLQLKSLSNWAGNYRSNLDPEELKREAAIHPKGKSQTSRKS